MTYADRSAAIYAYIESRIMADDAAPTVREIAAACGIPSISTVRDYIMRLERAGKVSRTPRRARSLRLGPRSPLVEALRDIDQAIEQGRPRDARVTQGELLRRLEGHRNDNGTK
jgi:SOS-response transcriptional repressor LexA